ncbi:hypothetical protein PghCCS26_25300 [Paenibacillus glycanilyticus]|uniref:Ferric oxidoreductase domain-containing protein n=1 Tax=Paenibacillus glycanilyticus TaxID=126569 RepID=A0ABQ6NJW0_9BACL|nr:hypothetical protein [Paenibacillus glycanilyticus]GMK45402.1 hypothetical protein PghCCS26_25300 [Paenibacillus glycanilyticus]
MKPGHSVFVPAVVVALASLALIFYAFFGTIHQGPPGINPGERGSEGLLKTMGTIAVWCAAISYAWLRLKRKRKSPSPLVKKLVKLFDQAHRLAGYAAIVLIAAHGIYFLTQSRIKDDTYTGIAGFALLFSLGIYGFLIRRVKNKHLRKIHFLLATAFAVVAIIHAGGSAIIAILSTIVFWGLVWLIERRAAQQTGKRAA